jgi:hypothetical protein
VKAATTPLDDELRGLAGKLAPDTQTTEDARTYRDSCEASWRPMWREMEARKPEGPFDLAAYATLYDESATEEDLIEAGRCLLAAHAVVEHGLMELP